MGNDALAQVFDRRWKCSSEGTSQRRTQDSECDFVIGQCGCDLCAMVQFIRGVDSLKLVQQCDNIDHLKHMTEGPADLGSVGCEMDGDLLGERNGDLDTLEQPLHGVVSCQNRG